MACDYWGIEQDEAVLSAYDQAMNVFSHDLLRRGDQAGRAGLRRLLLDGWCRFDFFLVCTSLLDQFAAELLASVLPLPPMLLRVLRVIRILRILRLLKGAPRSCAT